MRDYVIFVDNCSNMTKEAREPYGIKIVYMHFFMDEKMYDASPDFEKVSNVDFNNFMRGGKRITTSQITVNEYEAAFEEVLKENKDILYIACSSKLSASIKEGEIAKDNLLKKYPEAKIEVVDSYTSTYALQMMVMDAAERQKAGVSLEENVAKVIEDRYCYNYFATPEKLTWLKMAGRVSAPSAFFGGLLSVKPIIINSKIGENVAVEKVKGRRNSYQRIAELAKEWIDPSKHNKIYVAHADCLEDAKEFASVILEVCKDIKLDVEYGFMEPCVGASCGPGMLALCLYTKPNLRDNWEATK